LLRIWLPLNPRGATSMNDTRRRRPNRSTKRARPSTTTCHSSGSYRDRSHSCVRAGGVDGVAVIQVGHGRDVGSEKIAARDRVLARRLVPVGSRCPAALRVADGAGTDEARSGSEIRMTAVLHRALLV